MNLTRRAEHKAQELAEHVVCRLVPAAQDDDLVARVRSHLRASGAPTVFLETRNPDTLRTVVDSLEALFSKRYADAATKHEHDVLGFVALLVTIVQGRAALAVKGC